MDESRFLIKSKEVIDIPKITKQIELAQIVLDEKGLIDYTANVVFKDGKLHAGNDRMFIISPIDIKSAFSVNGYDLCRVIGGIVGEASLSVARGTIFINSKKVKAELSTWEMDEAVVWIDQIGLERDIEWSTLPKDFWEGMKWCQFSASRDISVRSLTCLKISGSKVFSTDNFRVSRYIMDEDTGITVLIPRENAESLLKFPGLNEFCVIFQDEVADENSVPSWIIFRNPETGLICGSRLVLGSFPDEKTIEDFFVTEGEPITLPEELKAQVNRAGKFAEGIIAETTNITVEMKNKLVKVVSRKASGFLEQESETDYDGDAITFDIIPALFEQILSKVSKISVCDRFLLFDVGNFNHALIIRRAEEGESSDE